MWESLPKSSDNSVGVIDRQSGLCKVGKFGLWSELQLVDIVFCFDEHDRLRCFAHRADYFIVSIMSDQHNRVARFSKPNGFHVHFCDEWACGIYGEKLSGSCVVAYLWRDAVGREQEVRTFGYLIQVVHEYGSFFLERLHNVFVMDNFVKHVDGTTECL